MQFTYADPIHSEATTKLGKASTDYFSSPCDESSQGNERTSGRAPSVSLASLFSISSYSSELSIYCHYNSLLSIVFRLCLPLSTLHGSTSLSVPLPLHPNTAFTLPPFSLPGGPSAYPASYSTSTEGSVPYPTPLSLFPRSRHFYGSHFTLPEVLDLSGPFLFYSSTFLLSFLRSFVIIRPLFRDYSSSGSLLLALSLTTSVLSLAFILIHAITNLPSI